MKNEIEEKLLSMQDKKYKNFQGGLCPGTDNIIGVRTPQMREYAKEISKRNDWREVFIKINDNYYEEILLQGLIIGYAKMDLEERLNYLKSFIPKINNWAICDLTCNTYKFAKKDQEKVWNFLQKYINSKKEFEVRFAIIMMLSHYINDEYVDSIIKILDNIKHEGYYVKMAVAWTLQVIFVKYQEKGMKYLKDNSLDDITYNKALQKMIESYRITPETKDVLRSMKR